MLSLRRGDRARTAGAVVAFLGEAKCRGRKAGSAELRRLEHIRDLPTAAGHDASHATLGLFGMSGFTADLLREARSSDTVLLGGLDLLYGV